MLLPSRISFKSNNQRICDACRYAVVNYFRDRNVVYSSKGLVSLLLTNEGQYEVDFDSHFTLSLDATDFDVVINVNDLIVSTLNIETGIRIDNYLADSVAAIVVCSLSNIFVI